MNQNNANGSGRQRCRHCSSQSVAGLIKGEGLCPYHWAEKMWGTDWAKRCHPNYPGVQKHDQHQQANV